MFFSFIFRRAHLRDCLELLKDLVPSPPEHQKATTLALLQSAQQYIKVIHLSLGFFFEPHNNEYPLKHGLNPYSPILLFSKFPDNYRLSA